jgi:fumarate reductase subunit C
MPEALDLNAVFCTHCAYDLRASTGDTCPECGKPIDQAALRESQIPWLHRRQIGRLRALWATAFFVTFRTKRMAYEIVREVDLKEALRFRRTVVGVLWLAILAVVAVIFVNSTGDLSDTKFVRFLGWPVALTIAIAAPLGLLAFLHTATGIHTYWFHPKQLQLETQNRAIALSYFACAPLVYLTLAIILGTFGGQAMNLAEEIHGPDWLSIMGAAALIAAGCVGLTAIIAPWRVATVMAASVARRGAPGKLTLALGLPVLWTLLLVLLAIGLPLSLGYIMLMLRTW